MFLVLKNKKITDPVAAFYTQRTLQLPPIRHSLRSLFLSLIVETLFALNLSLGPFPPFASVSQKESVKRRLLIRRRLRAPKRHRILLGTFSGMGLKDLKQAVWLERKCGKNVLFERRMWEFDSWILFYLGTREDSIGRTILCVKCGLPLLSHFFHGFLGERSGGSYFAFGRMKLLAL